MSNLNYLQLVYHIRFVTKNFFILLEVSEELLPYYKAVLFHSIIIIIN